MVNENHVVVRDLILLLYLMVYMVYRVKGTLMKAACDVIHPPLRVFFKSYGFHAVSILDITIF